MSYSNQPFWVNVYGGVFGNGEYHYTGRFMSRAHADVLTSNVWRRLYCIKIRPKSPTLKSLSHSESCE